MAPGAVLASQPFQASPSARASGIDLILENAGTVPKGEALARRTYIAPTGGRLGCRRFCPPSPADL